MGVHIGTQRHANGSDQDIQRFATHFVMRLTATKFS